MAKKSEIANTELVIQELTNLKCQNGTSSWGGDRHLPHAFTEEGVAML